MAIGDLLSKKVNIAGREVPVGVLLVGGGGVVILIIVSQSKGKGPSENPIDVARQIDDLTKKVGAPPSGDTGGGGGGGADIAGQLAAWSAGFGKELSGALAAQNKQNEASLAALQKELEQFQRQGSPASGIGGGGGGGFPQVFPNPEAAAAPAYSSPAVPFIQAAAPSAPSAPVQSTRARPQGTAGATVGQTFGSATLTPIPPVSSRRAAENPELQTARNWQQRNPGAFGGGSAGASAGSSGGGGGGGGTYTVRSGDVLSRIARRYNVSLSSLLAANPQITNANRIRSGQVINLPG